MASLILIVLLISTCIIGVFNNPIGSNHEEKVEKGMNMVNTFSELLLGESMTANNIMNSGFACAACKLTFNSFSTIPISSEQFGLVFYSVCTIFETSSVCKQLMENFIDLVYYIYTHSNLTSDEQCDILVGASCLSLPSSCNSKNTYWNVELSQKSVSKSIHVQADKTTKNTKKITKILQLSDPHIDQLYTPGSNTECDEPLCCRAAIKDSIPDDSSTSAGFYGDYKCDIPVNTVVDMMRYINESIDYDYLMLTGDILPHDVWSYNQDQINNGTRLLTNLVNKYLSYGKMVFPVIGNHESAPVDQFSPRGLVNTGFSSGWVYEELWNQWSDWIPHDQREIFITYGYYSRIVSPNFKVIVLNTNYCSRLNYWNVYQPIDFGDQLKWLVDELNHAEIANQYVHILGHIPVDMTNCVTSWVHNYIRILERYSHLVKGQFFGHTHLDDFRVYYADLDESKPIGVAYVAPSLTPYQPSPSNSNPNSNPAFRIYQMDQNANIIDHVTYFVNLAAANVKYNQLGAQNERLEWGMEYSAKQAYQMSDLSANEWDRIYKRMKTDDQTFDLFYQFYHRKREGVAEELGQCHATCKKEVLSYISVIDLLSQC